MNLQETIQEPTQPTRFFKRTETNSSSNGSNLRNQLKSHMQLKNNSDIYKPQLPKISRRRIATQVQAAEKDKHQRNDGVSTKKIKGERFKQFRNTRSRSSFYSIDPKGKKYQFKVRHLKTAEEIEEYNYYLRKLQELYQLLSQIMLGVYEANPNLIKQCLTKYMLWMEEKRYQFLDYFIKQLSPKGKRTLNICRIQQYMSILYIAQRVLTRNLQPRQDTLVNMSGFCAGNIIFIAKLFILSRKVEQDALPFQQSIKQYQIANFKQQLVNYDQIITRIQHNNQTIKITEVRIGKGDFELHNKLKDFIKMASMQKFSPSHCFYYLFEYFSYYLHLNGQLGAIECLQTSPAPYLPYTKDYHLTVVIEPIGVLICQKKYKMGIRPHSLQFLNYLQSKNCEIILWTQMMPASIKQMNRIFEKQKFITHKLYRYHCTKHEDYYIKDIKRLGRDMDRTIILDYSKQSFMLSPKNGIQVPWNRSVRDKTLIDLIQIFSFIIKSEVPIQLSLEQNRKQIDSLKVKSKSTLGGLKNR